MKRENLYKAIGDIEDTFVNEAHTTNKKAHPAWHKWGAVAACLALMVLVGSFFLPSFLQDEHTIPPDNDSNTVLATEMAFSEAYLYYIDGGAFATYVGGKVIDESKIGDKLEAVTLTAGWRNREGEWLTEEHLRGELYLIEGISPETAVALKFLDKGEALTTTHYYTLLNPEADLTDMLDYCIPIRFPEGSHIFQSIQSTDEFTNEATQPSEEYVEGVTVTSQASE